MRAWLYAVAYRYGVAAVGSMDYAALEFWFQGHEQLLRAEEKALADAKGGQP